MKERNATIDVAKGLGILLVVLGHNALLEHDRGEPFRIVFSFHVPLFFFLSGVFLSATVSLRSFLLQRADQLLKPYFVVLLAWGVLKLVLRGEERLIGHYLGNVVYASGPLLELAPLWFLPHLVLASATALIVAKALSRRPSLSPSPLAYLIVGALLLVGAMFIDAFWLTPHAFASDPTAVTLGLPWSVDLLAITSATILLGHLLSTHVRNFEFRASWFALALVVFAACHWHFDEAMDLNLRHYGDFIASTLQAGTGVYLCLSLAALLQRHAPFRRALAYVGSSTLFILIFHTPLQNKVYYLLAPMSGSHVLAGVLSYVVGIGGPVIMLEVVRRLPFVACFLLPRKAAVIARNADTAAASS